MVEKRTRVAPLLDQPGQLRSRQVGRLVQVGLDRALVRPTQVGIAKGGQGCLNKTIDFEAGHRLEIERFAAGHEIVQILQGSDTVSIEVQDHSSDDPTNPT